jgi:hypothetical protein
VLSMLLEYWLDDDVVVVVVVVGCRDILFML